MEIIGSVKPITSLTDYQSSSVVSKMLINKKAGTVTAFAFEQGEGLSEHTAPFDAMLIGVEGEAIITIDNREQTLRQGEILIIPARSPHSVNPSTRFKMLLVMIKE